MVSTWGQSVNSVPFTKARDSCVRVLIAALQVDPLTDPSSLGIGRETEAQRIFF